MVVRPKRMNLGRGDRATVTPVRIAQSQIPAESFANPLIRNILSRQLIVTLVGGLWLPQASSVPAGALRAAAHPICEGKPGPDLIRVGRAWLAASPLYGIIQEHGRNRDDAHSLQRQRAGGDRCPRRTRAPDVLRSRPIPSAD